MVTDGRGHNDQIGLGKSLAHGFLHFPCGLDVKNLRSCGSLKSGRSAYQGHLHAPIHRSPSESIAHFTRRWVGQKADGVDPFPGWTG